MLKLLQWSQECLYSYYLSCSRFHPGTHITFSSHVSLVSCNLVQFLHLPLAFCCWQLWREQDSYLTGYFSIFFCLKFPHDSIFGRNTTAVTLCPPLCLIAEGTQSQLVPLLIIWILCTVTIPHCVINKQVTGDTLRSPSQPPEPQHWLWPSLFSFLTPFSNEKSGFHNLRSYFNLFEIIFHIPIFLSLATQCYKSFIVLMSRDNLYAYGYKILFKLCLSFLF